MNCRFCESYDLHKRVGEFKQDRGLYDEEWNQELTAALVIHDWTKRQGKKNAARTTDYRYRGLGFKLNYCPECGKKLKEEKP